LNRFDCDKKQRRRVRRTSIWPASVSEEALPVQGCFPRKAPGQETNGRV
jgi:hypothetical protein